MMTQFKVQESWDDVYKFNNVSELPWVNTNLEPIKLILDDWLSDGTGARALEVGCGAGQIGRLIAGFGYDVTGIDISAEAIALCNAAKNGSSGIYYEVANSLTYRSPEQFDLVVDFMHIHDIHKDMFSQYIHNIDSLLKCGGNLLISTFTLDDPSNSPTNCRPSFFVKQNVYYYGLEYIKKMLGDNYQHLQQYYFVAGKEDHSYKSAVNYFKKCKP
jgi:2-polyprenyl-3-methyl-5-hydroxy-6-metoxy-1,4-benzoquinol methylase